MVMMVVSSTFAIMVLVIAPAPTAEVINDQPRHCCGCGVGIPHPHSHDGVQQEWDGMTTDKKQHIATNIEKVLDSLIRSGKENCDDEALDIYFNRQRTVKNYSNLRRIWNER